MKIGFVIPARLKSSRLKKKILMNLGGQSALAWAIDRANASVSIDEVVVATTPLQSDSEVTNVCIQKGIRYFQGSPEDVLCRLKDTAEYFGFDYVVNITPDNTLFSIYMIDLMVAKIKENPQLDFLKYKDAMLGTGIYAIKKEALQTISEFKNVLDTEIWGPLIHESHFNIEEMEVPSFLQGNYRLTMDTDLDYLMMSRIYSGLNICPGKIVELEEVIRFLKANEDVAAINANIVQNNISQNDFKEILEHYKANETEFKRIYNKYYKGV